MSNKDVEIPNHIGIILDGNRRWAKERNLPTYEGHRHGYEVMKKSFDWFFKAGVKILSLYVFSTENWKRSQEEVNYLMKLLKFALEDEEDDFMQKGCQVLVSGRIDELPGDLAEACFDIQNKTKSNQKGIVNICLNYGGQAEIIDAIKKIIKNKIAPELIHEGLFRKYLYNGDLGDPDIIVRTSGEQRLSGFMLWQSAYSELLFLKKYWPEFEITDVEYILNEYKKRKRRFGGDEAKI